MIFARKIDEQGYFICDAFVEEITELTIETPCPAGFYRPRWDGTQWVEGGTAPAPVVQPPTEEDRLSAVEAALASLMGV